MQKNTIYCGLKYEVIFMRCPKCGDVDSKVLDSRVSEDGKAIRRRRECYSCSYRFTTYEKVEETPIMVVKKNNERQVFNRDKILRGLIKACEKRPVPIEKIEDVVNKIEQKIRNSMVKEIKSSEIGNLVMKYLKELDEVAYVRFASVYRRFTDVSGFVKEVEKLKK
jgi:transcriptional repressor NrdR